MDDYDAVYDYLNSGTYPTGFSKNQRRVLRRRCLEHFRVQSGIFYYSSTSKSRGADRKWKMAVQSTAEKERVLRSCHSDEHGRSIISFI